MNASLSVSLEDQVTHNQKKEGKKKTKTEEEEPNEVFRKGNREKYQQKQNKTKQKVINFHHHYQFESSCPSNSVKTIGFSSLTA